MEYTDPQPDPAAVAPHLSLWDTLAIMLGIVVGTSIFRVPPLVFAASGGPGAALGIWVVGGLLSLVGALCYVELATSVHGTGGDYSYLREAFGSRMGFLFAWCQLSVILSGSIAAMSYVFADYAGNLMAQMRAVEPETAGHEWQGVLLAIGVIACTTVLNLLGISFSKKMQALLTTVKIAGLVILVLAGTATWMTSQNSSTVITTSAAPNWGLGLVFVLYAFGGWNDAAFVASEVRQPDRNIPRALCGGLGLITLIYFCVNATYLSVLGYDGTIVSRTPATDVMQRVSGAWGASLIALLVMVSAWGAIQGMIFTGSRVYASVGQDHRALHWLAVWDRQRATPVRALVAQAIFTIGLVLLVGTPQGRSSLDGGLLLLGCPAVDWQKFSGGFEALLAGSAPVFWTFFFTTGLALPVLRWRKPNHTRTFSVPLYPLTPIVFCATCAFMIYSSLDYARSLVVLGLLPTAAGVVLYAVCHQRPS